MYKDSDIMGLPWLVAVILLSVLVLTLLVMAWDSWNTGYYDRECAKFWTWLHNLWRT